MTDFSVAFKKKDLVGTLAKIAPFLPKSASATNSTVYLQPIEDGLRVAVSYPEAYMRSECLAETGSLSDSPVAIDGKRLVSIIKQADTDVRLDFTNDRIELLSESSKWVEPTARGTLNNLNVESDVITTFKSDVLLDAINRVKYLLTKETVRPSLFMVDVSDGKVRASNGSGYHEVKLNIKGLSFSVPTPLVDSFCKLLKYWKDSEVSFKETEGHYHFVNGDDVFSLTKVNQIFPDLDRMLIRTLKAQCTQILLVNRESLAEAIKKVKVASNPKVPYIEMHINPEEVLLRCFEGQAEAVASVAARWDMNPRIALFNVDFLYDIVYNSEGETIEIKFGKDTKERRSPLVIEGANSWAMTNQLKMKQR